jgi:hypothetical protein
LKPLLPFLAASLSLLAAPPAPDLYKPDLAQWRLEVSPDLGGWLTSPSIQLRIKLVDPRDPAPPKEPSFGMWEEPQESQEPQEAPEESVPELTARLKAQRLSQTREQLDNAWRQRRLQIWFNGSERSMPVQVGYALEDTLACRNGENRLELFEPDSGLRVVRTWWASTSRTRLQIAQVRGQEDVWNGSLEVMEPNGDLGGNWRRTPSGGVGGWNSYVHANPPAGAYTLRWTGGSRFGQPGTVVVEAILDGGTEQERRWRFSRVILPGAGPATLGTLTIEN